MSAPASILVFIVKYEIVFRIYFKFFTCQKSLCFILIIITQRMKDAYDW